MTMDWGKGHQKRQQRLSRDGFQAGQQGIVGGGKDLRAKRREVVRRG